MALPRSVSKDWRRDLSLELPVALLRGPRGYKNGDRNAILAIGGGDEMGTKPVSAHPY